MKVRTEDNRVFDVTPGKMFQGKIHEPEWFPTPRADLFEVGFHNDETKAPTFHSTPEIGDRIAADFQQDGPFGEVWYSPKIIKIGPLE